MTEQWQELKETIIEMRDNAGTGTQQEVCKFLANYMEILEKQMQQPTRPTARWERLVDDFKKCSRCGRPVKFYRKYKYCPECGAKMEEIDSE